MKDRIAETMVSVKLTDKSVERLKEIEENYGISLSSIIRIALVEFMCDVKETSPRIREMGSRMLSAEGIMRRGEI